MKLFFLAVFFSFFSRLSSAVDLPELDLCSLSTPTSDTTNCLAEQIAQAYSTDLSIMDFASSKQEGNLVTYSIILRFAGADKMSFSFSDFLKSSAATLSIRSLETDIEKIYSPTVSGTISTELLSGSVFIVQLSQSFASNRPQLRLHEFGVSLFRDSSKRLENSLKARSASCNIDIACQEGLPWKQLAGAVCKLYIKNASQCTGTLVNNTAENERLFVLTANHCISNARAAENTVFIFNHENSSCGGVPLPSFSVSGSVLRATSLDKSLDFALVEILEPIPVKATLYFAGWDATSAIPDNPVVAIHHPQGDLKKISQSKYSPETAWFQDSRISYSLVKNSHWLIKEWEYGVTEGGSSGSALINSQQQIIGSLTGGDSKCGYPYNDYFQKISYSWDYFKDSAQQLKYWLDPLDLGVTVFNGIGRSVYCGGSTDELFVLTSSTSNGYVFGTNESASSEFGRSFTRNGSYLFSVGLFVADNTFSVSDTVYLRIYHSDSSGMHIQAEFPLSAGDLVAYSKNIITLPHSVKMSDNTLVSIYIPENNRAELSLYSNYLDGYDPLTYVKLYDTWLSAFDLALKCELPMCIYSVHEPYVSNVGFATVTQDGAIQSPDKYSYSYDSIVLFPNPSSDGVFTIALQGVLDEFVTIHVFTVHGSEVQDISRTITQMGNIITCDFGNLPSGIYFIRCIIGSKTVFRRISIQRQSF